MAFTRARPPHIRCYACELYRTNSESLKQVYMKYFVDLRIVYNTVSRKLTSYALIKMGVSITYVGVNQDMVATVVVQTASSSFYLLSI